VASGALPRPELMTDHLNRSLTDFDASAATLLAPAFIHVPANSGGQPILQRHPFAIRLGDAADQPLISCLLVTQNRPAQAQIAIECYRRQTWPAKELVVIDTSVSDALVAWARQLNDATINAFHIPGCTDSLGDMRNLSVEKASGDFVCQWDDDDLHHPARLQAAAAVMAATGAKAFLLLREMIWLATSARLAMSSRRANENTVVCEKSRLPRYPSLARREDTPVISELVDSAAVAFLDMPELYVRVAHGSNTWDEAHMEGLWRNASARFTGSRYDTVLAELSRCHPINAYLEALDARATVKTGESERDRA
jgi:glycosyltransferase involved in cell wall biosynthesis